MHSEIQQRTGFSANDEMKKVPILHLGNVVADSSSGRIIQRLVTHLGAEAYRWHVGGVCGLGDIHQEFTRLGAEVVDFSNRDHGSKYLARRIHAYVAAHKVRIVHTHSPRARLAAAMALIAAPETAHLATEHLLYSPRDRRWGLVYAILDRSTLYPTDHIVAVSKKMQLQLAALPGINLSRVTAVQNAIDCDSYCVPEQRDPSRAEFGLIPESFVIGYAGRIESMKRLDLLLEGFATVVAQHPQARLMLIGEGEQRQKLKAFAASLGISHVVIWTGFRQDIPRLLAAMDVYVQASVNEGLSLSILEAMAAGKAIVATDVGGAQEVLTHQETGILITPGSSSAIALAIADLLNHPQKRARLAASAKDHVAQEFGVERMVEGYRRVYEHLVSSL
jgi:glycosyltransferase involved in cell wall biosynthesis